jgi:hypothetical protein
MAAAHCGVGKPGSNGKNWFGVALVPRPRAGILVRAAWRTLG